MPEPSTDRRVVACNYRAASKIARQGALAYVLLTNPGGGHDRMEILVRSRIGRWVRRWEDTRRLTNFRAKTLPPEHPRYDDERIWDYDADDLAGRLREWFDA